GTVDTLKSGRQIVSTGGVGVVNNMSDGKQVLSGGSGTVTTLDGGRQIVFSGAYGTVTTMNSGGQAVDNGAHGTISTLNDGYQYIENGGAGSVNTLNGGTILLGGGTASVANGTKGIVSGYGTIDGDLSLASGTVIADGGKIAANSNLSAGTVTVNNGGSLVVTGNLSADTLSVLGSNAVSAGGTLAADTMDITGLNGGTEAVLAAAGAFDVDSVAFVSGGTAIAVSGGSASYNGAVTSSELTAGVTLSNHTSEIVTFGGGQANYYKADLADKFALGDVTWTNGGTYYSVSDGPQITSTTVIDASGMNFTNSSAEALTSGADMTLLYKTGGFTSANPVTGGTDKTLAVDYTDTAGIQYGATAKGDVTAVDSAVKYTVDEVNVDSINLGSWNGSSASLASSWTGSGVAVDTGDFTYSLTPGETQTIFTGLSEGFLGTVSGNHAYTESAFSNEVNGVTLAGTGIGGVKASGDGRSLTYYGESRTVTGLVLGEMTWGTSRDASGAVYDYTNATIDTSGLTFAAAEDIVVNSDTTLFNANSTLSDFSAQDHSAAYSYNPLTGVTLNGTISGSIGKSGNDIIYTANANTASKLTFGDVSWLESVALIDHSSTLTNVTFNGADVDTSSINFNNIDDLKANSTMTLVSEFGDSVGTITGTKYKVGTTLQGKGKATLDGNDLIYTAETDAVDITAQEQTHNTLMGAVAGMAALGAGNDFIGATADGLGLASNAGADGMSTYAKMGGGTMRQETGSHVNSHTWNGILAVGHNNKKEKSSFEYGAFLEYGTGSYTTVNGDERGDGSARYTGGGLLGKWMLNNGTYVEGSLRLGRIHDDARNILRDSDGVPYSYETDANYWGAHIGVGREIAIDSGHTLELYGKFLYNRRGSVSFNAGGHYDLDAVASKVLRIGTRYVLNGDKWNFYGGVAYEHEFDGLARGRADGVAIRNADIGGGSFRGELGATLRPDRNSPWEVDFNLTGFAGKKRGISGGVSLKYMF
uniref:hypothetical protein n=1 Tax=Anaerovibrio sp. TaxID=1872532 RepID=UPI0025D1093F